MTQMTSHTKMEVAGTKRITHNQANINTSLNFRMVSCKRGLHPKIQEHKTAHSQWCQISTGLLRVYYCYTLSKFWKLLNFKNPLMGESYLVFGWELSCFQSFLYFFVTSLKRLDVAIKISTQNNCDLTPLLWNTWR